MLALARVAAAVVVVVAEGRLCWEVRIRLVARW
jgi:hypothetical protein